MFSCELWIASSSSYHWALAALSVADSSLQVGGKRVAHQVNMSFDYKFVGRVDCQEEYVYLFHKRM